MRRVGMICAAVFAAGAAGWLVYALRADPDRAWRALLINFLYFSPMASGMVVWPAVVMLARGNWSGPSDRWALAGVAFAPLSLLTFLALWLGRTHWAGWLRYPPEQLPNAAWLNPAFLFTRDAIALLLLWALAALFARRARTGKPKRLAACYIFTYCMVWTLLGFDLVMALDPHWFSCLFGAYFFVSGMYIAVAAWTFALLVKQPPPDVNRRHDLGKLIVAFSLVTMYMMYSQLIVLWYANFRSEVRYVVPRLTHSHWVLISAVLLSVIYLGPLVILLTRWSKKTPRFLGAIALLVLAGLWIERWWEVTPTLGGPLTLGLQELSITTAFAAAMVAGVRWFTHTPGEQERTE